MDKVHYVAWIEYSDGGMGYVDEGYKSADEAERAARERLESVVVMEDLKREHGGVKAIMIRESKEVRRVEL